MDTQMDTTHQDVYYSWYQASKEAWFSLKHFRAVAHCASKDASKDIAAQTMKQ